MSRICTIQITPDRDTKMNVETGDVTSLEIVEYLAGLQKHFASLVIADYVEITGDKNADPDKLTDYIAFLRNNNL